MDRPGTDPHSKPLGVKEVTKMRVKKEPTRPTKEPKAKVKKEPKKKVEAPPKEVKTEKKEPAVNVMDIVKSRLRRFEHEHRHLAGLPKKKRTSWMQHGASKAYITHLRLFSKKLNDKLGNMMDDSGFRLKCVKNKERLKRAGYGKIREATHYLKEPRGAGLAHMLATQAVKWIGENTNTSQAK